MKNFENKVVVITGAASGIGRALAIEFAAYNCKLALCDLDESALQETKKMLSNDSVEVLLKKIDVSDKKVVFEFAEEVKNTLGNADIVINNAGVALGKLDVEETSLEQFEWIMGINFWGMVYGTKAFLPQLKKNQVTAVVNISSLFGLIGATFNSAYCASKFGIRGFNEVLMIELLKTNIQVHSVHPGGIKTNIAKNAKGGDLKFSQAFEEKFLKMPPSKAAKVIINGIQKNKQRIIVGNDAKFVFFLSKIVPLKWFNIVQSKLLKDFS
jgi:butyryl-CoA dehydrogenase